MKIIKLISDFLKENVYVIKNKEQCLIIDCGVDINLVKEQVGDSKVVGILLTHGHFDHSRFSLEYAKEFDCKIYANKNVTTTMKSPKIMYGLGNVVIDDFTNFVFIEGDKHLKLGNFDIDCYYCPGHSVCCECYLIDEQLFAGDVIFDKAIGRTDLINSNKKEMLASLKKLEKLKFKAVYSGHGNESTYEEQLSNIQIFKKFFTR